MKQVPGVAVLNFDFVIPFAVPFRFQNVPGRVRASTAFSTGRGNWLAATSSSARQGAMATIKVANKAKLLGVFIGSNVTWGPVLVTSILRRSIARHIAALANHGGGYPVLVSATTARPILRRHSSWRVLAETTSPQSLSATWLPLSPPVVKS